MNAEELKEYLDNEITDADIEAWHNGELTQHMSELLDYVYLHIPDAEVQIWGSRVGSEPLHIIVK
ncbi:hypothetical protein BECAL_02305 [Bellilinea caldifistulae]|uniref:Uncharacterized protein n=1 Tax=Bellilinea caldifistulae TaxID=360411 RepID=A0A0P6XNZ8_9CHLR|nr:hypothetical protein [Bellilinea caldifistulae]KPL73839.1 hypothetical protein AC812_13700 [Bellilinea caldifistulae]GAP11120.1 hypothetical protein BECAL_02305 [Bellilinea caldifistulae]